jgi:hypothetical protein
MSDLISTIPGIGPLAVGIFNEARYTTIEHLRNFNGDDRQLQEVIDRRKVGSDSPDHTGNVLPHAALILSLAYAMPGHFLFILII